jgi:1-acyl-sn-glycerol-3-phosphate acyltransferase
MFYRFMYHFFAPWIIMPYVKLFNRLRVSGFENIPASGPAVIIANHMSLWDPVLMFCLIKRRVYFMAKEELFSIPFIGYVLRRCFAFPVKRTAIDRSALKKASQVLNEGHVLVIFPEGHRSKNGDLQPFKEGAALFAHRADAPVIPVLFENTFKIFPKAIWKTTKAICGAPLDLSEFQGKKTDSALLSEMTDRFTASIRQMHEKATA